MLRLASSSSLLPIVCRRCLSAAAASPVPPQYCHRNRRDGPRLFQLFQQQHRRTFLTLAEIRAWFVEGPEAAAPFTPPTQPPSLPVVEDPSAASSFFVQDAPAALQGLLDSSSAAEIVTAVAEPTFASMGLGTGFWPTSLHLKLLEFLHVSLDAPWWLCALALGVLVRLIVLVPNLKMQRVTRQDMPKMRTLHLSAERFQFALKSGNVQHIMQQRNQFLEIFPDMVDPNGIAKMRNGMFRTMLLNTFVQLSIQLAAIRALYKATSLPVESFQLGGLFWFTDLTCIDPYCLLPAGITALLLLNIRHYFNNIPPSNTKMLEFLPIAYTMMPVACFTIMLNMPGANLVYFATTGLVAQALHRLNTSNRGKQFWKARIGLIPIEELPPILHQTGIEEDVKRIKTILQPAAANRDYKSARFNDKPGDQQIPKTFRLRKNKALSS